MVVLCALSLSGWTQPPTASDVRWRLVDRDTVIEVPYQRLVRWAANRQAEVDLRREVVWSLNAQRRLTASQNAELDHARSVMATRNAQVSELAEALAQHRVDLAACRTETRRLNTWATIGKGVVVIAIGAVAAVVIVRP